MYHFHHREKAKWMPQNWTVTLTMKINMEFISINNLSLKYRIFIFFFCAPVFFFLSLVLLLFCKIIHKMFNFIFPKKGRKNCYLIYKCNVNANWNKFFTASEGEKKQVFGWTQTHVHYKTATMKYTNETIPLTQCFPFGCFQQ